MEFVKVPLNIAQRAARVYRPMMPYVRKFIAERRNIKEVAEVIPEDISVLPKDELLVIAESMGKGDLSKLSKQKIIERISE